MSSQKGSGNTRNRPQKYKNRFAFKNDLHDKTPQQKMLNSLHVCEVCEKCKSIIEWKIKYKKYKPLPKPKTCIRCQNRNIKKAYHVICRECAIKEKVCAKCLKSGEEVAIEPPGPTEEDQLKLKVEMERLIKSLPERKRRTFLRFMKKGKQEENLDCIEEENIEKAETESNEKPKKITRIPHSRDDLLKKIEFLKLDEGDEEDDDDDFFVDSDSEEDFSDEED